MRIILRYYSIVFLAVAFLPILLKNLPWPFTAILTWALGWIILLALRPKIFSAKIIKPVLISLFIYGAIFLAQINDDKLRPYILDIFYLIISISIFTYFIRSNDLHGLKMIINWSLLFIVITIITSYIGFVLFPESIRYNPFFAETFEIGKQETLRFRKMGIADLDFFYAIAYSTPALIFMFKYWLKHKTKNTIIFLFLIIITFLVIIKSNYATAFLICILGIFLGAIGMKNFKKNRFIIFVFLLIIMLIPTDYYAKMLNFTSMHIEQEETLQARIDDLSVAITEPDTDTHTSDRLARIPFLMRQIIKSPFWGGGETTNHVYWLDIISLFGILGIIPFIILIYRQIKYNLRILPRDYKYYYLLCVFFYLITGFFKNIGGFSVFLFIFLIVPGIGLVYKRTDQSN